MRIVVRTSMSCTDHSHLVGRLLHATFQNISDAKLLSYFAQDYPARF